MSVQPYAFSLDKAERLSCDALLRSTQTKRCGLSPVVNLVNLELANCWPSRCDRATSGMAKLLFSVELGTLTSVTFVVALPHEPRPSPFGRSAGASKTFRESEPIAGQPGDDVFGAAASAPQPHCNGDASPATSASSGTNSMPSLYILPIHRTINHSRSGLAPIVTP